MMRLLRRARPPARDPELVDQLADRPELLVLADELHRQLDGRLNPHRQAFGVRSRATLLGLGVIGLAVAAVVVVLISPWGSDVRAGVIEDALDAIGDGTVVHVVARGEAPGTSSIDIESGAAVPSEFLRELWYDEQAQVLHVIVKRNDQVVADLWQSPNEALSQSGPIQGVGQEVVPPPLVDLVVDYRAALASDKARLVGEATLDGEPVYLVDYSSSIGVIERVYLDAKTYLPIATQLLAGTEVAAIERVETVETITRESADLSKPTVASATPVSGRLEQREEVPAAEAAKALDGNALWPGRSINGIPFLSAAIQLAISTYPEGSGLPPERTSVLELNYGTAGGGKVDRSRPFLIVREGLKPSPAFGWDSQSLPPPPGTLEATDFGAAWRGRLVVDGVYVTIEASTREMLLDAARALRPITK